jgi:hypothetical protein
MKDILQAIRVSWSWAMPAPRRIMGVNKFGNVLVEVDDGAVWRICPEELSSARIAGDAGAAESLMTSPDFRADPIPRNGH